MTMKKIPILHMCCHTCHTFLHATPLPHTYPSFPSLFNLDSFGFGLFIQSFGFWFFKIDIQDRTETWFENSSSLFYSSLSLLPPSLPPLPPSSNHTPRCLPLLPHTHTHTTAARCRKPQRTLPAFVAILRFPRLPRTYILRSRTTLRLVTTTRFVSPAAVCQW